MSAERLTRRTLRSLTFWRVTGALVGVPRRLAAAVTDFMYDLELAVFYRELDAARRYRMLTGVDLGVAAGEPDRYRGVRRARSAPSR